MGTRGQGNTKEQESRVSLITLKYFVLFCRRKDIKLIPFLPAETEAHLMPPQRVSNQQLASRITRKSVSALLDSCATFWLMGVSGASSRGSVPGSREQSCALDMNTSMEKGGILTVELAEQCWYSL